MSRQCHLLGISRSGYYYKPKKESELNLRIMKELDKKYMESPFFGVLRMQNYLSSLNYKVNIKRVRRLMRLMGLNAIYCKPNLSKPDADDHKIYPYLLRGVKAERANQIWSTDITYIPMKHGFMYLTAVIEWYSRYVLSWRLSNSLDTSFCMEVLNDALNHGQPEIFNTDQGAQYTSKEFTGRLEDNEIQISMDGKGRALDNIFVERLWRTVKYEHIYIYSHSSVRELYDGLKGYFDFYNNNRPHQSLGNKTPAEVYFDAAEHEKDVNEAS